MAKNIYTYDVARYLSLDEATPTGIDFDNPVVATTLEISTGYAFMGGGVTSLNEAPTAQTNETGYINSKSKATTVDSYSFKFSGNSELVVDEEAVMSMYNVPYYLSIGTKAERNLLIIDTYAANESGEYNARLFRVSVAISNITNAATEKVTFDFELNGVKDPVFGTYNTTSKTFTVIDPNAIVAPAESTVTESATTESAASESATTESAATESAAIESEMKDLDNGY